MRTYWLSFVDRDKPEGQRFLGCCIVDVTRDEAREALTDLTLWFPSHLDRAEWPAAASRVAHRMGCNPGGEMAAWDITGMPDPPASCIQPVKNRLMTEREADQIGKPILPKEEG